MRSGILLSLALSIAVPAPAATIVVPDSVGTIAGALALAVSGDSVLVQPGTYPETLVLVDGVTLAAFDPASRPTLDGASSGPVITAQDCGAGTVVSGFVVRHGISAGVGGGMSLTNSSMQIDNCRFQSNSALHGGGVGASGSSFTMDGCEFEMNSATQTGGAVSVTGTSSPVLADCRFASNDALAGGAVAVRNGSTPSITTSLFDSNLADQGGGIWYDFFAGGALTSCTMVFNDAASGLGAGAFFNSLSSPVVTQCILAFGSTGGGIFAVAGAGASLGCNDVFGNAGGDSLAGVVDLGTNLALDPLFCDAPDEDYTLQDNSPALPGGACGLIGAYDAGGCGATGAGAGVASLSWGGVKALYD